jgi:hypothetical protein
MKYQRTACAAVALLAGVVTVQPANALIVYGSIDWLIAARPEDPFHADTSVDGLFTMTDYVQWGVSTTSPDPLASAGIAFFTSGGFGVAEDLVLVTTVYGVNLTPDADMPTVSGFSPSDPGLFPLSVETITSQGGTSYQSGDAIVIPVAEIGTLLPGHDLSWFDFSDPFTILYAFQVYAPLDEFYTPPCPGDFNDDGLLDLVDISGFIGAFLAGDPAADFDANGVFDLTDLSVFIQSFQTGCP